MCPSFKDIDDEILRLEEEWYLTRQHLKRIEDSLRWLKVRKQHLEEFETENAEKRVTTMAALPSRHKNMKSIRDLRTFKLSLFLLILTFLTITIESALLGLEGLKTSWMFLGPIIAIVLARWGFGGLK